MMGKCICGRTKKVENLKKKPMKKGFRSKSVKKMT